jgi:hypothetical protein
VYLACDSVKRREALSSTRREGLAFKVVTSLRGIPFKTFSCIANNYCYWFPQGNKCYWQNKLGQYSLVESVRHKPKLLKAMHALVIILHPYLSIVNPLVIVAVINSGAGRSARKPGKPVELSAEVQEALVQSLERTPRVF